MAIKYHVRLTDDERTELHNLIKQEKPRVAQYKKRNAGILLAIDENNNSLTHDQTSKDHHVKPVTITRLRQRLVEEGLEVAVHGSVATTDQSPNWMGKARRIRWLMAIVCSPPPEGRNRWTLNLIRDRMIELEYVDTISRSTIYNELKKTNLNPGVKKNGVFLKRVPNL